MSSSNVSSVVKHFPQANEGFITTLGSTILSGAATVPLTTTSGLTNGSVFVGIIEPGVVGKEQTFTGTVDTSGTQITGVKWTRGSNTDHNAGVTIVDYVTGTHLNIMSKGIQEEHNQDGTHGNINADSLASAGPVSGTTGTFSGAVSAAGITNTGDSQLRSISLETIHSEYFFDYVASGLVWSGDAYGSTRVASMTSGVVYINGKRVAVSAVTSRTFTASKDTYVDVDNTGALTYTEVSNNAASPALSANNTRIAIIVTGASNIANVGSVNQGQEDKVLPIASSVAYTVTDSLGNLICPRDPMRKVLGYRQRTSDFATASGTAVQVTGLSVPVIIPTGRKIKITVNGDRMSNATTTTNVFVQIWDGTVGSGTQLAQALRTSAVANGAISPEIDVQTTPSSTSKTYNAGFGPNGGSTATLSASSTSPSYIKVELV